MKRKLKILIPFLLIFAIIAGFLSLSIRPEYSGVNYKPYDNQNKTDKEIRFNSDGRLKILHITDTHLKFNHNFDPTIWLVEKACDREKPDIVMLTGDIVLNCENAEDTKKLINALMNVFESRGIPVAITFGNHDSEEGSMTREELMEYWERLTSGYPIFSIEDGLDQRDFEGWSRLTERLGSRHLSFLLGRGQGSGRRSYSSYRRTRRLRCADCGCSP